MLALDLTGKVAIVTGATGELGRTMVRTLARAGADPVIHTHTQVDRAEVLGAECEQMGRRAWVVQGDITDEGFVKAMQQEISARLGDPSIIVANAVIQYPWTTILDQAPADFESQYRSCTLQQVLLAQAFLPPLVAAGQPGRYVGINTECSMIAAAGMGAYTAGKRGMDGVLRVLAREMAPHAITVNQIAPGWIASENKKDVDDAHYVKTVPMGRRGTDQEVANVVAFLASDLASFVTGAFIPVSGGTILPAI